MSKLSIYPGQSGLTLNGMIVRASDHGYIWTGTEFEDINSKTDAQIESALVAFTAMTSSDTTHVGYEMEISASITEKVEVKVFEGSFSVGMAAYASGPYDPNLSTTVTINTLDATFTTLKVDIADFLGWKRNTEGAGTAWSTDTGNRLNSIIKAGMRSVYYPANLNKDGAIYEWSFMFPTATLTTSEPYDTGTVTVVDGVVSLPEFGIDPPAWPSWAASGELTVSGGTYLVDTRDSDSQITLVDTSVDADAGTSYIIARPFYDLPSDFDGLHGEITYAPGQAQWYRTVDLTSYQAIRRRRQHYTNTDKPAFMALRPKAFVTATGQRWQAVLDPTPDGIYNLEYPYKVQVSIDGSSDVYFMGGPLLSELITVACLAIAEQRFKENGSLIQTQLFEQRLLAAMEADANAYAPDTLGIGRDRSDSRDSYRRYGIFAGNEIFTVDGEPDY